MIKKYTQNTKTPRLEFAIELNKKLEFVTKAVKRSNMPFNQETLNTYFLNPLVEFELYFWGRQNLSILYSAGMLKFDIMYHAVWSDWNIEEFGRRYKEFMDDFLGYPEHLKKEHKHIFETPKTEGNEAN